MIEKEIEYNVIKPGRPSKVNQQVLNKMVEMRKQGFTSSQIAQKVGVSIRTVKKYLLGVSPLLERRFGLERRELFKYFIQKEKEAIYLLFGEMNFKLFNFLVLKTKMVVDSLDDLVVDELREDERLRNDFIKKFLKESGLISFKTEQLKQEELSKLLSTIQSSKSAFAL